MAQMSRQHLQYLIDKGKLPGPSLQVPGRRLFTEEDVQRILDALQSNPLLRTEKTRKDPGP
jgi:hypothetical protein